MGRLAASIIDETTGEAIPARVHVVDSTGGFAHPRDAILKVGPGVPFFYSDGSFEVDLTRGPAQIVLERGTEYVPVQHAVDVPARAPWPPRSS